ncbi:LamG domain-containing protein, partial [candidate division TA06 bacterium]|nr:LamG domain-containing protein [candidate division TA06 bacterium]
DNFTTNLTYTGTAVSGVTITKYVAEGYAIDVIKDMLDLLDWQLRIDEADNVIFEPKGTTNPGITFTNGINFQVERWIEDRESQYNHVKIKGALIDFRTRETIIGTGTEFILSQKPVDTVRVEIPSGTELPKTSPTEPYTVDSENKKVIFTSSKTDPTFDYTFHIPVVVEDQDDASISTFDEIFKEIPAPWLDTFSEARQYAQKLLEARSLPEIRVHGFQNQINFDREVGEIITVTDPVRADRTEDLVISKIIIDARNARTRFFLGTREDEFFDWQREVQERIKKIERRILDETEKAFSRLFKHKMLITLTLTETFEFNQPVDSFVLGHQTLSRLRPNLNFEADCSDNANHGTWNGTGIAGAQYSTSGFLRSTGQFNGSDNFVDIPDDATLDITGDFSFVVAVKVASLPGAETYLFNKLSATDGYAVRINASNKVELIYRDSSSDTVFAATTGLTAGVFQEVVFVKSGTSLTVYVNGSSDGTATGGATVGANALDLEIGKFGAGFFTGDIDEVMVYDNDISASTVLNIFNALGDQDLTDMKGWWSMDNPRLGDRFTTRATVT